MRPTETARIASTINEYLDRYEAGDPDAASLRRADIARACRVAKRHLSREDEPEFAALKRRIERLEGGEESSSATISAEPVSVVVPEVQERDPELPLGDLGRDIARRQMDAVFRLRQWLAYYETPGQVLDSPVMLADLDDLVGGLRRIADDLRPLIAGVNRIRSQVGDHEMPLFVGTTAVESQ